MRKRKKQGKRILAGILSCLLLCSTVGSSFDGVTVQAEEDSSTGAGSSNEPESSASPESSAEPGSSAASGPAVSGNCGAQGDGSNLTWAFDEESGVLTISGSGRMEDYWDDIDTEYNHTIAPWSAYADQIRKVVFEGSEIEIGNYAFYFGRSNVNPYTALTEVSGEQNVTAVGSYAFYHTLLSETIDLRNVQTIKTYAFYRCDALDAIRINSSCSIESSGFSDYPKLIVKDGGSSGNWRTARAVSVYKDERVVMLTANLPILGDGYLNGGPDAGAIGWYRLYYPEEEEEQYSQWGEYEYYVSGQGYVRGGEPTRILLTHHKAVAASCSAIGNKEYWSYTEDGVEKYFDEDGNDVESAEQFMIPKEPHQYDDDYVCTVCGQKAEALVTTGTGEVRAFDDLAEAFSYAMTQDGCRVKLWQDIDGGKIYHPDKGRFTLDLCGKKITGSLQIGKDCNLTLENSDSEKTPLSIIADSAGKLLTAGDGILSDPDQFVIKDSSGELYQTVIRDNTVWAVYAMKDISVLFKDSQKETYTCEYSRREQTPEVVVSHKGENFVQDTDYTVKYTDNVTAGTAQVTLTGMNRLTGTVTLPFTIEPSGKIPGMLESTTIQVENTCKKVSEVPLPENWKWIEKDADKALTAGEVTEAKASYEGSDASNYQDTEYVFRITRAACREDEMILYTGEGEKEATCGQTGLGHTECSICHDVMKSGIVTEATGKHTYEWVIDKEATETETGKKHEECTVCHDKKESVIIDRLPSGTEGPKPGTSETPVPESPKPGTSETPEPGTPTQVPSTESPKPGASETPKPGTPTQLPATEEPKPEAPTQIPATEEPKPGTPTQAPATEEPKPGTPTQAPSTEEPKPEAPTKAPATEEPKPGVPTQIPATEEPKPGILTQAPAAKGEKLKTSSGVSYLVTRSSDKNPTVSYQGGDKGSKVVIPKTVSINGVTYKVTSVAKGAFRNNKKLKKVVLGSNITKIGTNAFEGCSNLKMIVVKTTMLTKANVGSKAFSGIHRNAVFNVPKKKVELYRTIFTKYGAPKKAVYRW